MHSKRAKDSRRSGKHYGGGQHKDETATSQAVQVLRKRKHITESVFLTVAKPMMGQGDTEPSNKEVKGGTCPEVLNIGAIEEVKREHAGREGIVAGRER